MHRLTSNIGGRLVMALAMPTALILSNPVQADDAKANGWSGSAELGVSATTGNSRNTSINGKLKLGYRQNAWEHTLRLETLQASEDGNETANRTLGEFKTKYDFDPRNYAFGNLRGVHDAFSGYRYQASVSAGYGRRLWVSDKGSLAVEAGPGYRRSETADTNETKNEAIGRVHGAFEYRFSKTAKFNQDVTVLAGQDNTETESVTAVTASLTDTLAMKLSYTVQHNSQVPVGTKKTDTFTSVNLVYNFE